MACRFTITSSSSWDILCLVIKVTLCVAYESSRFFVKSDSSSSQDILNAVKTPKICLFV